MRTPYRNSHWPVRKGKIRWSHAQLNDYWQTWQPFWTANIDRMQNNCKCRVASSSWQQRLMSQELTTLVFTQNLSWKRRFRTFTPLSFRFTSHASLKTVGDSGENQRRYRGYKQTSHRPQRPQEIQPTTSLLSISRTHHFITLSADALRQCQQTHNRVV